MGHTPPTTVTNMGKSHGAHHTKFRQEMLQRDNPDDNLQISSTKRAFIECMFLPRRLRSLHQGYFPDLINMINTRCRPAFMSTRLVLGRVHVPPARSGQHDAVRHVNKPGNKSRTTPAWQLDHVNPAYSLKRHIMKMIMIIKIMIKIIINNNNINKNNNNYGTVI